MSYQNFNRLPIIDQTAPMVSYTVEQNVYGDDQDAIENGAIGWYVVEHSAINGDYIIPAWFATKQAAFDAMLEIAA